MSKLASARPWFHPAENRDHHIPHRLTYKLHTFLNLPHRKVRVTTRNPSSAAAQALAARGAEVMQADLDDPDSLSKAFENAHAIFLNTDFWTIYRPLVMAMKTNQEGSPSSPSSEERPNPSKIAYQTEVRHGENAVEAAAKIPTLERLIYSALPAVTKISGGKYHSNHADCKGAIVNYIENDLLDLAKKTSFIYLGAYNTNALLSPILDPSDGKYRYFRPFSTATRMPIIDVKKSAGPFVRALIEDEVPGTKLLAYDTDSYLTYKQICDIWSKASGHEPDFVTVTIEFMHEKLQIPMEILEAVPALEEYGYMGSINVIEPSGMKTVVKTKSWEEWMMGRDWNGILEA